MPSVHSPMSPGAKDLQTETQSDANEGAQEKSTICTPVKGSSGWYSDTTLQNKHPFASLVVKKKRYEKICHHVRPTLTAFPAPKLSSHTNDPEMPGMDLPPHTTQATPVVLLCPPCIRKVSNIWDHQTRFKYCSHMSCIVGTFQSFYELIFNGELTSLLKALRKIT